MLRFTRAQPFAYTLSRTFASESSKTKTKTPKISLYQHDILSQEQFDRPTLEHLFKVADSLKKRISKTGVVDDLKGKFLANVFFEPSTRTASSFQTAMNRLGGQVIPITAASSSVQKGETLADTVRVLQNYADAIVLRHPVSGAAKEAAHWADIPVLNAGDGSNEHPTQALLDLYAIQSELGKLDNLTVTLLGDLKFGRTVHSMAPLLALFNIKINLVSPAALKMPEHVIDNIKARGGNNIHETDDLESVIGDTDALYVTRVQKERFASEEEYLKVKGSYVINQDFLKKAKSNTLVLHPLPRVDEISPDVDADKRSIYFKEPRYGMLMRMALLRSVLLK
jgi:aspartate carbamoyltransferase